MFVFNICMIYCKAYLLYVPKNTLFRVVKSESYQSIQHCYQKEIHSFKQSGESLTINPLAGSICTQFMWGMESGILVLLALAFCSSTTQKVFSHKNRRKFSFYCRTTFPGNRSQLWNQLLIDFSGLCCWLVGIYFTHDAKNIKTLWFAIVRSLKEKRESLNRGKLNTKGKYLKIPLLSSTGLVPEQEIKGAPTQTTHEHGSWAVLRRIEKAGISDELIAWWSRRGWIPLFRQR